jgi:S-DNA-T family DNA segregation ATPase FtsK/SpoIIIE
MTRKLRLKRNHLSVGDFTKARATLEGSLQIWIDTIQENREQGSIDIVYSHFKMPEVVTLGESLTNLPRDTFVVGMSRAQQIKADFKKTPHFLVGGQTGGGKSTFLRQLITTLYLNNKDYQFKLIDLKGGLEFQIFENVPRIKVVPDVPKAIRLIGTLEKSLNYRFETLKMNGCKDIIAFFAKPVAERKYPKGQYREAISRTVVVIDEVADLFMANADMKAKEVQHAKRILSKVGAQGRAVGLHLIVATQRPDVKALDSQVKTHLVGVVCFPMANDASSMTVLGNGRATDLPMIPGRAIWKSNMDMVELQTPFLSVEDTLRELTPEAPATKVKGEDNEKSVEDSRDSDPVVPMEVESSNDDSASD